MAKQSKGGATTIKGLINRYQGSDPILFDIFNYFLGQATALTEGKGIPGEFGPLTRIANHVAADFAINGGEVWNVIGVATLINRSFRVTNDNKWMYYDVEINNSTVVTGGLGAILFVTLPAGYLCAGNLGNQTFTGAGHTVAAPGIAFEPAAVFGVDATNTIQFIRPGGALFVAAPANFSIRFSLFLGVEYQGGNNP